MSWEAWTALAVVAATFGTLALANLRADLVLLGSLTALLITGVIEPREALAGLSNEGLVSVALLFVVSAGLRDTGAVHLLFERWLGRPKTVRAAQLRLMAPVAFLSTCLNNTPIVAAALPMITEWARKNNVSASKVLIPLSYAAILGGICTLIGTSTNLVVNGLVVDSGRPALGLFDITLLGAPIALMGILYVWLLGDRLLPDRKPALSPFDDAREYSVEMIVEAGSALVGQSIEDAGLRSLPNVYLMEIERRGELMVAVSPRERLLAHDRLVFVGVVDSVVELQRIRGLAPATNQVLKLDAPRVRRVLIEAVVSTACPIVGNTVRDGRFRNLYNAVIIAVARDGERILKKIGDIVLQPGDTLLLEAPPSFLEQQRNSRDFFLVSRIDNAEPPRHAHAPIAIGILVAMMVAVVAGWLPMVTAALLAAGLMVLTGCSSPLSAQRSIDLHVLVVIACAFGVGRAIQSTGAADVIAHQLLSLAGDNPHVALAVVYGATMLFTETMSNAAAAALMFPIALTTAATLGVSMTPFVMALMIAASASYITPIGYQTNLMVYGPGGYKFSDYVRIGGPLSLLQWGVTIVVAPLIWPF